MSRLHSTINAFGELGVEKIIPLHCTGFNASMEMARSLGEGFVLGTVGSVFEF